MCTLAMDPFFLQVRSKSPCVTFQIISFLKENQFLLSRHMSIQTCRMGSEWGVGGNQIR